MDEDRAPATDRWSKGVDRERAHAAQGWVPALVAAAVATVLAIVLALGQADDGTTAVAAAPDRGAEIFPDTSVGVHVFDDQLPGTLSPALLDFVAEHVDGAQKLPRSLSDALHARNDRFVVLQYRLGIGLGYRTAADECEPAGEEIRILDGDDWVLEWPADPDPRWFSGASPDGAPRYLCDWGWFLVDTDAPSWRRWFTREVSGQLERTGADGLFLDSVSPPNQLGTWDPALPAVDPDFEEAWSARIAAWLGHVREELSVPVIANAGAWVTSRDTTDYSTASGVMIEGFALPWADVSPEDWALQMDRALSVVLDGGVLIGQAYPDADDLSARMFVIGSYLLVKGERTFVNLEVAEEPTWFPEYDLPTGPAADPVPGAIDELREGDVYVRRYRDATVIVNPTGAEAAWVAPAGARLVRLVPEGGGLVPQDGILPASWGLRRQPVEVVLTLGPREAAIVVPEAAPAAAMSFLSASLQVGLTAFHRDGQTFLTWDERDDISGEAYRVHRSGTPIDPADLGGSTLLAEVGEGSARIWSERNLGPAGWGWRYLERAVIEDGAEPLPPDRGLLVWTTDAQELGGAASGEAWYAVEIVDGAGITADVAVSGPVRETIADPRPIHVRHGAGGRSHLMLQFMDLSAWNPTFHAPHERNAWLGFEPGAPGVAAALAYAYTYVVAEPEPSICPGGVVPDRLPVLLDLHGWNGESYPADLGPSAWYCAVQIRPVDSSETWWFGFAADADYRRGETPASTGRIVNFTEQRILRMIHDLLRDPVLGPRIDPERLYVYGHSMGGTGTLALALRYPTVFAAAYASEPMTDMARSGDGGGIDWRPDVEWKWGRVGDDLPVELHAPGGWAATIERYAGSGVYSWQDHATNVLARRADESVPFGVAHGTLDDVVEWSTQGEPFYPQLSASSRSFGGAVRQADHTWLGFDGLPATLAPDDALVPFAGLRVVLGESMPAFSDDTTAAAWPPDGETDIAIGIAWSASWDPWDGPPVDSADAWAMSFRAVDGRQHEVDITPRRLQRFRVEPGVSYAYEISAVWDGRVLLTGAITADADGLLTVESAPIDDSGVRLTITSPRP